jgi:hypothetical protein
MINVKQCLNELNLELKKNNRTEILYICGGSEIILLGCEGRETSDIDTIQDAFDDDLVQCIHAVGLKLKLEGLWLNNQAAGISKKLEKNWKKKTQILFEKSHLVVRGLNRQDLISTKMSAMINRQVSRDELDILWLKPTESELVIAKKFCLESAAKNNLKTIEMIIDAFILDYLK